MHCAPVPQESAGSKRQQEVASKQLLSVTLDEVLKFTNNTLRVREASPTKVNKSEV
jgi:hypothetical protein